MHINIPKLSLTQDFLVFLNFLEKKLLIKELERETERDLKEKQSIWICADVRVEDIETSEVVGSVAKEVQHSVARCRHHFRDRLIPSGFRYYQTAGKNKDNQSFLRGKKDFFFFFVFFQTVVFRDSNFKAVPGDL